jgi:hypothetical protein
MVKNFSDEIVLGTLVIMRLFCVIYVQRSVLNKHLRHFHHVSHVSFIPTLVSKSYWPCIFHSGFLFTSFGQAEFHFEGELSVTGANGTPTTD